jgi:hypothetical protein
LQGQQKEAEKTGNQPEPAVGEDSDSVGRETKGRQAATDSGAVHTMELMVVFGLAESCTTADPPAPLEIKTRRCGRAVMRSVTDAIHVVGLNQALRFLFRRAIEVEVNPPAENFEKMNRAIAARHWPSTRGSYSGE